MREEEESHKETDFCELLGVVFSQGWTARVRQLLMGSRFFFCFAEC
jgi:hypothetical protein